MFYDTIPISHAPYEGITLGIDEIHIWSANLKNHEKEICSFESILSEDEHQRAKNLRSQEHKKNFIISRGILRKLLSKYLAQSPEKIEILYGIWGKPHVFADLLRFNISHSKNYALYAVTRYCEVGIDIEYINKDFDVDRLAPIVLSSQELAYWKALEPEQKILTFFKFWVCKEAYLKSTGKGWLNEQHLFCLKELKFSKSLHNNIQGERMSPPSYFQLIPHYASAFFLDGPLLRPFYFNWDLIN